MDAIGGGDYLRQSDRGRDGMNSSSLVVRPPAGLITLREQELPKRCGMQGLHDFARNEDALDLARFHEMNSKLLGGLQLRPLYPGHALREIGIGAVGMGPRIRR